MRILSGIQPSGALHLGNYFAMMKPMIEYQEKETLFCFIVNYHALTTVFDRGSLRRNTVEAVCDFLSLGLDPDKAIFWIQSDIPEVTELTWILSNVTSLGLLERAHSYKDKLARGISPNTGLFIYPILMAADILLFGAEKIPVGKDQQQHVEMVRDIAIRFNHIYGETFVIPESHIVEDVAVIPGIDGQKMSKSYNNTIQIFCAEEELRKKVMSIKTDSKLVNEPKDPDRCILFALYSLFLTKEEIATLRDRYITPGLKYSDIKKELYARIWEYFSPFREKRKKIMNDRDYIAHVLKKGAEKARAIGEVYLARAQHNVGLDYWV
ncbi:MAG: tryptophan--tRNA ligase [bacterium]